MSRILLSCPIYAPYPGGGGSYFPLLVKLLEKEGEDVTVLTEYYRGNYFNSYGKLVRILLRRDSRKKGLLYSIFSFVVNFIISSFFIFFYVLKNPRAKIIFTRYYSSSYLYFLRFLKFIFPNIKIINDLRTELDQKFIHSNFQFVDKTISNSKVIDFQLSKHRNLQGVSYLYIPNFLELPTEGDVEAVNELVGKKYVVFIGTLSKRKGFEKILLSINRILKHDELFVIVGREVDISFKEISKYITIDKFIYYESLNKGKVFWLQKFAQLVLLPSVKEGLPRVALETFNFHGRIVLPTCCPEFFEHSLYQKYNFTLDDLVWESNFRRVNPYCYNVSVHSVEQGFQTYYEYITR